MTKLPILSVALLSLALSSTSLVQTASTKEFLPPLPPGQEWKLIWNDEFDGNKLDEAKWNWLDECQCVGCWLSKSAQRPRFRERFARVPPPLCLSPTRGLPAKRQCLPMP